MVFVCFFSILGGISLWRDWAAYPYLFALSVITLALTLAKPSWLTPFNQLWMRFGELLHRIVSPIVLGIMFFLVFTPYAFVMRLFGRDAMHRRFDREATTYWIRRHPEGPSAESFRDQF